MNDWKITKFQYLCPEHTFQLCDYAAHIWLKAMTYPHLIPKRLT